MWAYFTFTSDYLGLPPYFLHLSTQGEIPKLPQPWTLTLQSAEDSRPYQSLINQLQVGLASNMSLAGVDWIWELIKYNVDCLMHFLLIAVEKCALHHCVQQGLLSFCRGAHEHRSKSQRKTEWRYRIQETSSLSQLEATGHTLEGRQTKTGREQWKTHSYTRGNKNKRE